MRDVFPNLLVDLYELTMAAAYARHGMADRPATFSLFVRELPPGRGYLVAAGLDDALAWLEHARWSDTDLAIIRRLGVLDDAAMDALAWMQFSGSVRAVPEGTVVFPGEPLLEVDAPLAEAQLAETFLLNQLTLQTTQATTAARFRHAAAGRAVVDFGLRRAQGVDAGMKAARACRLVGLAGTSNVAAADRYGLAASGTMAHAFVQAYVDETEAFLDFGRLYRDRAVFLVDTYDTARGIDRAIEAARDLRSEGIEIAGIRLDSGDLAALATLARRRLDEAGFERAAVFASGGLDEHEIQRLLDAAHAPIDGFGVGSALAVSPDAPTLDAVYKLVAYDGRPVRKTSAGKATLPGAKQVWRAADWSADRLGLAGEPAPGPGYRSLLVEVMRDGRRTDEGRRNLAESHDHFERQWAALPAPFKDLCTPPAYPVELTPALRQLVAAVERDAGGGGLQAPPWRSTRQTAPTEPADSHVRVELPGKRSGETGPACRSEDQATIHIACSDERRTDMATTTMRNGFERGHIDLADVQAVATYRRSGIQSRPATFRLAVQAVPAGWGPR